MKHWMALALGTLVLTSTAQADDLMSVYQRALGSDPQIREADANRLAAREARPQAIAEVLPNITGFGQYAKVDRSGTTLLGQNNVNSSTDTRDKLYSLTLRQTIFSWSDWVGLHRANKQVAQAEADYQAAQQDLVSRVAERYFDVLAAQDTVEAQSAALQAIARQLSRRKSVLK